MILCRCNLCSQSGAALCGFLPAVNLRPRSNRLHKTAAYCDPESFSWSWSVRLVKCGPRGAFYPAIIKLECALTDENNLFEKKSKNYTAASWTFYSQTGEWRDAEKACYPSFKFHRHGSLWFIHITVILFYIAVVSWWIVLPKSLTC